VNTPLARNESARANPAPGPSTPKQTQRYAADLLLICVALVWGLTFTMIKEALGHVEVFVFLGQRFALASLFFIPFLYWRRSRLKPQTLIDASVLGVFLFGAFAFQTLGLKYTTASNTAFVTGMNVIFVPLINALLFKVRIPNPVWAGAVLAGLGLAGMTLNVDSQVNPGDLIVLICAVCIALQIIFTGRYAKANDVYWLTGIQVAVVAVLSTLTAWGQGQRVFLWEPRILEALVLCAPLATVFAFWAQTSMQRFTSASRAALIFCLEPVFGALYACLVGGETLGPWAGLGAGAIFLGMLCAEMPEKWWRRATAQAKARASSESRPGG
jgi:drug/metabolite transporter (DMT)-like permease